jgi:xanthine dehydrogenase YagR molybdenum-binding subunit
MGIIQKAMETVVKLLPDGDPDPLIHGQTSLGTPLSRVDGTVKVSGTARFTAEVPFDNLAFGSLVCSTIARGHISEIDTAAAAKAPGVVLVMTHENAPRMDKPRQLFTDSRGAATSDLPVMQDSSIHWNGEPVALVIAETQEQADYAATLIRVSYEAAQAETIFDADSAKAKSSGPILGEDAKVEVGHAEAALKRSKTVVDEIYRTPRYNHAAIELHAATAIWESDDRLTVYDASQLLGATQATLAKVFGLDEKHVRIIAPFVGGAFGNKGVWNHQILCAAAAKLTGRPVRLVLSREDVFRITGGRTLSEQRVALGAEKDGHLTALIHTGVTAVTAHNQFPEQFTFPARHLYAADNLLVDQKVVELDMIANTSMRAPGESIGTFGLESALDELAFLLNMDPIELRLRNEPEVDPTKGTTFSARHLVEAYRLGAERFGWSRRSPAPGSMREGIWRIGHGVATATYPYYRMLGATARIRLTRDGRAVVAMASHEMGMGTATVQAQHAADRLGLAIDR